MGLICIQPGTGSVGGFTPTVNLYLTWRHHSRICGSSRTMAGFTLRLRIPYDVRKGCCHTCCCTKLRQTNGFYLDLFSEPSSLLVLLVFAGIVYAGVYNTTLSIQHQWYVKVLRRLPVEGFLNYQMMLVYYSERCRSHIPADHALKYRCLVMIACQMAFQL